jgi:quercetin dioxygenase-like cupin family protein
MAKRTVSSKSALEARRSGMTVEDISQAAPRAVESSRVLDFRPGMAMRWEITRSTNDTRGELLETICTVGPRTGGPPVHVHETAEESYEVTDGTLEVCVDGHWRTLHAGEKVVVPAGTRHTLKNSSDREVRLINVHRPALEFEAMFREMQGLISARKIRRLPPKDPRSMIYAAMLFTKYPNEQRFTEPPPHILKALALLGRALGLRLGR